MASSHPAWSHWSDATVLDDYAMTTTTSPKYQSTDAILVKAMILLEELPEVFMETFVPLRGQEN